MRELQISSTQLASQQKQRDDEAARYLRSILQHIKDAQSVYNLKASELAIDVLRQLTLPPFYLSGDAPPAVRNKSALSEVFVCFLELIQNEWEATVTALHTAKNSSILSSL